MQGRFTIAFPLALLGLLALLTLWIDRTVQAPQPSTPGTTRHDPDYIVENFVSTRTDESGNTQYMLAAVEMRHFPDDDSTALTRPRFTQFLANKPYTQIEGQKGLVSSDGEIVQFMDNVVVTRQATTDRPLMTVQTDYLEIEPKTEVARTTRPVVIRQAPDTVIRATGMVYDKKNRTVNLMQRVKVHYTRPRNAGDATAPARPKPKAPAGSSKKAGPAAKSPPAKHARKK